MNTYGVLEVRLTHMEGRLRLGGATVEVRGERRFTDGNGSARITLPAPAKRLSLTPDPPARPFAAYDIRVSKRGYAPVTIYGLHIFDGITSIFAYDMVRLDEAEQPEGVSVEVPEHIGYGRTPYAPPDGTAGATGGFKAVPDRSGKAPALAAPAFAAVPATAEWEDSSAPVLVPETVTVHLGTPESDAINVTVPFINYIKSVACSEIYPTWPRESLIANINAQVSLILNRLYTEWYPSQGYKFDVSASPEFDQYYVHRREVFNTIDAVVDGIFDNYIARKGFIEPIFAQFCDGKQTLCGGLSQWGTVDLAEKGYSSLQIVRYYYGRDVEIRRAPIVRLLPDSYPGEPLSRGDSGAKVLELQNRLDRIAINYPAIPLITPPDGIYGADTEKAVRVFQQVFGLPATGVTDEDSWYRVLYVYVAVKKLAEIQSEGEELQSGAYPGNEVKAGDKGPNVLRMQWFINAISRSGQYPQVPTVELDGIYDAETGNAVRVLQGLFGFPQTGVVDRRTWDAITKLYGEVGEVGTDAQYPGGDVDGWPRPYPGSPVQRGDRGDAVYYIQGLVNVISRYDRNIPRLDRDGIFGPATLAAVKSFQSGYGLVSDGIVGPLTWEKLNAVYAEAEERLPSQG